MNAARSAPGEAGVAQREASYGKDTSPFKLPALPWPADALEPVLSKAAVELHHQKHHGGYVEKLNKLVAGTPYARMTLEELILATATDLTQKPIFNNAAQAWNHAFFFEGLRAPGPEHVPKALAERIDSDFGSLEKLIDKMTEFATERFGSGWSWLTLRGRALELSSTPNAGSALTTASIPLLAIDVWEHAYYIDYHEKREAYVRAVLGKLVDWDVVARRAALAG